MGGDLFAPLADPPRALAVSETGNNWRGLSHSTKRTCSSRERRAGGRGRTERVDFRLWLISAAADPMARSAVVLQSTRQTAAEKGSVTAQAETRSLGDLVDCTLKALAELKERRPEDGAAKCALQVGKADAQAWSIDLWRCSP